ncbi:MAG: hypothetical protein ACRD25_04245 [Terracidiphilus sp.]
MESPTNTTLMGGFRAEIGGICRARTVRPKDEIATKAAPTENPLTIDEAPEKGFIALSYNIFFHLTLRFFQSKSKCFEMAAAQQPTVIAGITPFGTWIFRG